jgi:hypothetical protein
MTRRETTRMGRRIAIVLAATAALVAALVPAAHASPPVEIQIVADAGAQAFAVRPSYDSGGATPLNFYVGYTEANVSTPEPQADGQASWYNFGIAETAAFRPPEECTPEKNIGATTGDAEGDGSVQDLSAWLVAYQQEVAASIQAGRQPGPPTVPSFRHACSERFPGFTQSRYPATYRCENESCSGIKQTDRDDLLTKPFCKDPGACTAWKAFDAATGAVASDGSFASAAGEVPSNDSAAAIAHLGDGTMISVGFASVRSRTVLEGRTLVAEATSILHDICIMRAVAGCGLHIDEMRQVATVRVTPKAKPVRSERTVLAGVRQGGSEADTIVLDGSSPGADNIRCCFETPNGQLKIQAISTSGGCTPVQGASSYAIADAGGLRIFGKGSSGGGIVVGGACARARVSQVVLSPLGPTIVDPVAPVPPTSTIVKVPAVPCPDCAAPRVIVGEPRVVTKDLVSYRMRSAAAWRTIIYWGPALGAMAALMLVGWLFRARPAMQPAMRTLNRFSRQFIKG